LRWRAEKLLVEIQSLQVNHSTWADVEPLLARWKKIGEISKNCAPDDCVYEVIFRHVLPPSLRGYTDNGVQNYLPRVINRIGLRSVAGVIGGFTVKSGVVTQRSFAEIVSLPVRVWFDRGGAYVPDLSVGSSEKDQFNRFDRHFYPYRTARNMKGPYGLIVTFLPQEQAGIRTALMDFRLYCITRFSPCLSEEEILPEGAKLLQETY